MRAEDLHPNCRIPEAGQRHGRCYYLAFFGACRAQEWVIVHGECDGPPGVPRMGHAWLEHKGKVYDPVLDTLYDAKEYAEKFHVVEHARYTFMQASERAAETEHTGPWPMSS